MSTEAKQDLVFKALGNPHRRQILDGLKDRPATTGEVCRQFAKKLDRCTVMQHLRVLENAGLVIIKREGRVRWNYINPVPIKELYDRWISSYASSAVSLLARMKREMEKD